MEGGGQLRVQTALPMEKEVPIPIGQEAGWAPEPVWTRWRKVPASTGNRTPVVHPVP